MNIVKPINIVSLEQAIRYSNDMVVFKFMETYPVPFKEASDLFIETKKWLWLCGKAQQDRKIGIGSPKLVISKELFVLDEMWHTFILFTRDYLEYCMKNFGFFIHHFPTTKLEKEKFIAEKKRNPELVKDRVAQEKQLLYEYIFENLGRETLIQWYSIMPEKYNQDTLKKLKQPV